MKLIRSRMQSPVKLTRKTIPARRLMVKHHMAKAIARPRIIKAMVKPRMAKQRMVKLRTAKHYIVRPRMATLPIVSLQPTRA